MKLLKRVQEFAAFTKNEQKIFLFLSIVFIAGVSVKAYRAYVTPPQVRQFDYTASDKEFEERSKYLTSAPPAERNGRYDKQNRRQERQKDSKPEHGNEGRTCFTSGNRRKHRRANSDLSRRTQRVFIRRTTEKN